MNLFAPAKINLHLSILDRRTDGYHNLSMLMEKVSLCDEITLEKIPSGIELVCETIDCKIEKNLAFRAAQLLQNASGVTVGARLQLSKRIPIGGGLGGGSSNAATVLKGLNRLWELGWPIQELAKLGVKLGADVPFFLYDGPARVEGIGDLITPLEKLPKLSIILVNPGIHVATPWAYSAWDKATRKKLTQENQSVSVPRTFDELLQILHNDFESVVIPEFPEIQRAKDALKEVGANGVLMSGSGSTVFGLFETKEKRDRALDKINKRPAWQMFAVENWGVDKR